MPKNTEGDINFPNRFSVECPSTPLGVVAVDPTARIIPTAEFISPYSGLSEVQQDELMAGVEEPTAPSVE